MIRILSILFFVLELNAAPSVSFKQVANQIELNISETLSFEVTQPLGFPDDLIDFVFVDVYSDSDGFVEGDCHVSAFQGAPPVIRLNGNSVAGSVFLLRCPESDVTATDVRLTLSLNDDISLDLGDVVTLSSGTFLTSSALVGDLPPTPIPDNDPEIVFLALENDRVSSNLELEGGDSCLLYTSDAADE